MELEKIVIIIDNNKESHLVEDYIRKNLLFALLYPIVYIPASYTDAGIFAPVAYLESNPKDYYYNERLWPFLEKLKKKANPDLNSDDVPVIEEDTIG